MPSRHKYSGEGENWEVELICQRKKKITFSLSKYFNLKFSVFACRVYKMLYYYIDLRVLL